MAVGHLHPKDTNSSHTNSEALMGCGNNGVQVFQIAGAKPPPELSGVTLRNDPKVKQSIGQSFNVQLSKPSRYAAMDDNAFCAACGQLWLGVPVPHRHNCKGGGEHTPTWDYERRALCDVCPHNKDGVCVKLKEILSKKGIEADALITAGSMMLRAYCPEGHWLPIEFKCPDCGKVTAHKKGVTNCSRCGFQIGTRGLSPALVRAAAAKRNPGKPLAKELIEKARVDLKQAIDKSPAFARGMEKARGSTSAFTTDGSPPRWVSMASYHRAVMQLVPEVSPHIDTIVGVARSGLNAATILSMMTNLPMMQVRQTNGDVIASGNGWRLAGRAQHIGAPMRHAIVVDDTVMTGNSLKAIEPILRNAGFETIKTAAVFVNPKAKKKPDVWAQDLAWPHLLEWNLFNSVLSPNMAIDFDGILCHDCPRDDDDDGVRYSNFIENARPKYLCRKNPIPLIVTARIEKYRYQTEAWLARWGIAYKRLIMHPAPTLQARRRDNIAAYKARHFESWARTHRAKPAPLMFVESEDRQAQEIHRRTGRLVVCPSSGACYGAGA